LHDLAGMGQVFKFPHAFLIQNFVGTMKWQIGQCGSWNPEYSASTDNSVHMNNLSRFNTVRNWLQFSACWFTQIDMLYFYLIILYKYIYNKRAYLIRINFFYIFQRVDLRKLISCTFI
jgi:hypothetical protein